MTGELNIEWFNVVDKEPGHHENCVIVTCYYERFFASYKKYKQGSFFVVQSEQSKGCQLKYEPKHIIKWSRMPKCYSLNEIKQPA